MPRLPQRSVDRFLAEAREFGQEFPQLAAAIASDADDPSVERLLESLAFHSATVLDEVSAYRDASTQALVDAVAPSLARATPTMVVLDFGEGARSTREIPAGATFEVEHAEAKGCRFTTLEALHCAPFSADLRVDDAGVSAVDTLRITLRATADAPLAEVLPDAFSFFVDGPPEAASRLRHALLAEVQSVRVGCAAWPSPEDCAASIFESVGLAPRDAPTFGLDGPRNPLSFPQQYFLCPERLSFVRVRGLRAVLASRPSTSLVYLDVRLRRALPRDVRFGGVSLRTNCVAATNVYLATAEPIRIESGATERHLAVSRNRNAEAFAVAMVRARQRGIDAADFEVPHARHAGLASSKRPLPLSYATHHEATGDGRAALVLQLMVDDGFVLPPPGVVVSTTLLASDGARARTLRPGHRLRKIDGSMTVAVAASTPGTSLPASGGAALAARWLRLVAIGRGPEHAAARLRALLSLCTDPESDADAARVAAIVAARVAIARSTDAQSSVHASTAVEVEVDESAFRGDGDVAMFGEAIAAMVATLGELGTFTRTTIVGRRTGFSGTWTHPSR